MEISLQRHFKWIPDPRTGNNPSHDTFSRVFMMIARALFERCFRAWTAELRESLQGLESAEEKDLI
ncbi:MULTISPECIES: transposase family protein [Sphingobacterium]|uniref:transposase family protein n=1 Tax=Sphingobacterium TaxID=28453 RepID=UPI0013E45942|nr:transposase family protein [Sphingobacterium sp. DR205]QIH31507.1 transposase family protein [Sphingobacterium sp. DR205]